MRSEYIFNMSHALPVLTQVSLIQPKLHLGRASVLFSSESCISKLFAHELTQNFLMYVYRNYFVGTTYGHANYKEILGGEISKRPSGMQMTLINHSNPLIYMIQVERPTQTIVG